MENNRIQYPTSLQEIYRGYYLEHDGTISFETEEEFYKEDYFNELNMSSEKRCKAILALIQLIEFRDVWNKIDDFVVDWENPMQIKFVIVLFNNKIIKEEFIASNAILYFKTRETLNLFFETFRDLIEEAKDLL